MAFRSLSVLFGAATLLLGSSLAAGTIVVTSTADAGPGSLRWAITQANLNPGPDVILFAIPGGGVQTIVPLTPLPALTDPAGVFIDGLSQPGAFAGPNPPSTAFLQIEIAGISAGAATGLEIQSNDNTVQGLVINQFRREGIAIIGGIAQPNADRNTVYCNFVGTDPFGTVDLGNGAIGGPLGGGIHIGNVPGGNARDNTIDRNLVSGNWSDGIWVEGPRVPGDVGFNHVLDNYVGTDITGMVDLGNDHEGIDLSEGTHDNRVIHNLVSGNDYDGIGLQGYNNAPFPTPPIQTHDNLIERNIVGLDINLGPLPNTMHGVAIGEYGPSRWGCADRNTVRENVIAFNGGDGVAVVEDRINTFNADNNLITENAIWANGGLGIDLENNGVTPNDPLDMDVGANRELNFPIITLVTYNAGITTIAGTLAIDTNPANAVVEIFQAQVDPAGFGEGELFIGRAIPDAAGNWSIRTDRLVPSDFVTTTATDMLNNTSEFSRNASVPGVPTLNGAPRVLVQRLGGSVGFNLAAGAAYGGRQYLMLGGLSGVTPGQSLWPLGPITVPLNFDAFTSTVVSLANTPTFPNFFGTLDAAGNGTAQLVLPAITPGSIGLVIHFAYMGVFPFDFTSNPVAIEIVGW